MPQEKQAKIKLDLAETPFNLDYTLSCGQVFRWQKLADESWRGIVNGFDIRILQTRDLLGFQSHPKEVDASFLRRYFRLDDDLPHIYSKICKDRRVAVAVKHFHGLRLMRQDPWECLISYICATNKNIPAIKNMIANMCQRLGKKIPAAHHEQYCAFPDPQTLAKASLTELKRCKLGFRAERIKKAAELVNSGAFDLEALKTLPYEEAKGKLMTLPGVGPKVADCVLLFSLDKLEAFPIDVWMKRIILEYYTDCFEPSFVEKAKATKSPTQREYKVISSFGRQRFGKYVGYAQEYLFHWGRCQQ